MVNFPEDFHQFLRHVLPGYLVLGIGALYYFETFLPVFLEKNGEVIALLLFCGSFLGYFLFVMFQSFFIGTGWRRKHFIYITKDIIDNPIRLETERLIVENDIRLYKYKSDKNQENERITFLTSKFYSLGAIFFGQIIIFFTMIIDFSWYKEQNIDIFSSAIVLSLVVIVYSLKEMVHSYKLVKEFNRKVIQIHANCTDHDHFIIRD